MAIIDMLPWLGRDRWTITPMWMSEDRAAVEGSLLRILALAQRENLDPKRMVELYSDEHWGVNRWRLKSVAKQMPKGTPLIQSLIASGLSSDDHTLVCLRIGESLPNPLMAWEESLSWNRPMNAESTRLWRNQMFYWTVVGLFSLNIISSFWFFCGPTFRRMLLEFDLGDYTQNMELFPVLSLGIVFFLLVVLQIYWLVRFVRWISTGPLQGQIDSRRGWGFASRRRECLRQMSLCLRAGIGDRGMIETLLKCNPNARVQRELGTSLKQIQAGVPVWQSLSDTRLLARRQAIAMQRCTSPDVQSWALQQFTLDDRESNFFARIAYGLWVQPALTLAFGAAVLLTGYALLNSLSEMIRVFSQRHG